MFGSLCGQQVAGGVSSTASAAASFTQDAVRGHVYVGRRVNCCMLVSNGDAATEICGLSVLVTVICECDALLAMAVL